jgi:hypothetical protein
MNDRALTAGSAKFDEAGPPKTSHLIGLFALAMLARAGWLGLTGLPDVSGDALDYRALTRNLAEGRGFTADGMTPALYRPPLFSVVLAAWIAVLGDASLHSIALFQILVHSTAVPLQVTLGHRLGLRNKWNLAAGIFTALYPYGFINIGMVLQEPLMTALVTLAALTAAVYLRSPAPGTAVLAGLSAGFCILAKFPHILFPWILTCVAGLRIASADARRFRGFAIILMTAHLVVIPWTVRNFVASGEWILVNAQESGIWSWITCDGPCPPLADSLEDTAVFRPAEPGPGFFKSGNPDGQRYLYERNQMALSRGLTGEQLSRARRDAGWDYVRSHPPRVLSQSIRGLFLSLAPAARPEIALAWFPLRIALLCLVHLPIAAGILLSLPGAWRTRNAAALGLAAYIVGYVLFHALLGVGEARHAIPLLPVAVVLALRELQGRVAR